MDARRLACDVLVEVDRSGGFADALLGRSLARHPLAPADRRLATLLVYGTLAHRARLDHSIAAYSNRPLRKLERAVLEILRLGLFQLAFMDRVPAYAAVAESVDLAKALAPAAAGYVNAVLRRAKDDGLAPLPTGDPILRASIELSHPAWLIRRWIEELGEDQAFALLRADNEPMPTVLRALVDRPRAIERLRAQGHGATPAAIAPDAIVCDVPACESGVCLPQSEGSQLVALYVGTVPGDRVLDACAAPGGKTAYLAKLAGADGSVVAVDPGRRARQRILATLKKADCDDMAPVRIVSSPIADLEIDDGFDKILVDAPCSGLGTLSEHPEIRWRRSPDDIADLQRRQLDILRAAAAHLRTGGVLVYATCTLVHEENDGVVDAFLSDGGEGFVEIGPPDAAPGVVGLCGTDGRLRTLPHVHHTGGFFAARLRRQ